MKLGLLEQEFSVCKLEPSAPVDLGGAFCFAARTDRELSLVCPSEAAPEHCIACEAGWRAMRVEGALAFSLVGILAKLTAALARADVGLFAVSTFDTDYILVKKEALPRAVEALRGAGCEFE